MNADRKDPELAERMRVNAILRRFAAGEDCSDEPAPNGDMYFGLGERGDLPRRLFPDA